MMKANSLMTMAAVAAFCAALRADVPPALKGDGVSDDTAAIQARLDSGARCVYLPPPKDHYVISKTLLVGSGQELRLDRFTRVRLAPKSDCYMVLNRNWNAGGDRRVAITGGIWDFDNVSQTPNWQQGRHCKPPLRITPPKKHDPNFYLGVIMGFKHVRDLQIRHVTFRNPCTYSCHLASVTGFRVDDITFDFDRWNPIRINMDGIHLDGDCHHGRITDLSGTCFDDMVALNANDFICSPKEAPISDIEIDGIHADYCHSAVRILSAGEAVERVTIRNIFGNFYTYVVGFTHYFPDKPRGRIDDVVVENIFAQKALAPEEVRVPTRAQYPIVWFQKLNDIGTVTLRNLHRTECTLPADTIRVDRDATVRHLTVRDCRMENKLETPIAFLKADGKIERLTIENNEFVASPGAWTHAEANSSKE